MSESRFVDLELRYMQLERTMDELSSVVADQAKTIERLRRDMAALVAQKPGGNHEVEEYDALASLERDRPPHY